jgi:hypothetical protein
MAALYRGQERRGPSRPTPGETAPCPRCGGEMRFEEHLAIEGNGINVDQALWVCRNPDCKFRKSVRSPAPGP